MIGNIIEDGTIVKHDCRRKAFCFDFKIHTTKPLLSSKNHETEDVNRVLQDNLQDSCLNSKRIIAKLWRSFKILGRSKKPDFIDKQACHEVCLFFALIITSFPCRRRELPLPELRVRDDLPRRLRSSGRCLLRKSRSAG